MGYYRMCILEGLSHGTCRKIGTSFKNGDLLKLNFKEAERYEKKMREEKK